MRYEIEFEPDMTDDKEEAIKNEICNSVDVTPGLAEAITGMTWREIFRLLGYS